MIYNFSFRSKYIKKMYRESRRMSRLNSETTLLKSFNNDPPRHASNSCSESGISEVSTLSSSLSEDSVFSMRTGSTANPPSQQYPPGRSQYLDRPLPEPHISTSSTASSSSSRRPICSSNRNHHKTSRHQNGVSQTAPFMRRRYLIVITIISLTFCVLSVGFTAYCFICFFAPEYEDHTFMSGDLELCIPCNQLVESLTEPVRHQLVTKITPDNVGVCCSRDSGQLSVVLENIMDKRKRETVVRYKEKPKFRADPVSAHKYLRPGKDDEAQCGQKNSCYIRMAAEMDWNREHAHGVLVRKNSLQVNVSGLYYIYSSVSLMLRSDKSCRQLTNKTFYSEIFRANPKNPNRNGILLKSSHTCSNTSTEEDHTSYSAGVFELEEADHIYMGVSDNQLVSYYGNGTFLGLVLLRNMNLGPPTTTPFTGQ